ncbi:hypothetical protein BD413DRAFT_606786 [Trametes elegans]|nr:hypothetical protein BD413DRAFT_606786 [Trametes elegans]
MSFLVRLFRRLRNPKGYVGRDLEGNQYFEYPGIHDDPSRTKRVVKYAQGRDMWAYIGGRRRLAVQWTAWLTHTRHHPPSLEELQADLERQRRLMLNVARIEARDREEAARIAAIQQNITRPLVAPPSDSSVVDDSAQASPQPQKRVPTSPPAEPGPAQREPPADQPSPWKPPPSDEPHSWQPRASVRRGG